MSGTPINIIHLLHCSIDKTLFCQKNIQHYKLLGSNIIHVCSENPGKCEFYNNLPGSRKAIDRSPLHEIKTTFFHVIQRC